MNPIVPNSHGKKIVQAQDIDLAAMLQAVDGSPEASDAKVDESNSRLDAVYNKLNNAAQNTDQMIKTALANKPDVYNNFLALASQPNPRLDDPRVQAAVFGAYHSTDDKNEQIRTITQLTHPALYAANANKNSNSDPVIPPAYTDNSGSVNSDSIKALLANKGLNVLIIAMYVMLLLGDTDDSIIRQDSETFNENTDAVNGINGAMDVYGDISKALQDYNAMSPKPSLANNPPSLADLYVYAYNHDDAQAKQLQSDLGPTIAPLNINNDGSFNPSNIPIKELNNLLNKYTDSINANILSISPGLTLIGNLDADDISSADKIGTVTTSINNITSTLKSAQTSGQSVSNKQSTQVQTDTTTYNNHISAAQGMLSVLKQLIQEIWR